MRMRKYIGIILTGVLSISFVGCSNSESQKVENASSNKIEETKETSATEESIDKNIVLVDDDIAKISIIEKSNDEIFGPSYKFSIENKSDNKIKVQTRDVSVDGYMEDPVFSVEVMPGKKANDYMTFMNVESLDKLKNIEGKLVIINENHDNISSYEIKID